jgi:hypothetical protein
VGDGPEGAVLIRGERRGRVQELRQEPTQRPENGGGEGHAGSAWQGAAEFLHQPQRLAGGLMGEVQMNS